MNELYGTVCRICGVHPLHPANQRGVYALEHHGRGLCSTCHRWARHTGRLLDYERTSRSREDLLEDYRMLRGQGHSRVQIAERLGMKLTSLDTALLRARRDGALQEATR
jgi:hypothetical protein